MEPQEKVFRAHRAFGFLYGLLSALVLLGLVALVVDGKSDIGKVLPGLLIPLVFLGGLSALHLMAARGARQGRQWARTMSRVIAAFMLLGFPIGTLIAIYLFLNTSKPWNVAPTPVAA
jgi:hypothetical protein